ncbi:hypothetical protein HY450_01165, partial [Candidatus Pacearchaeota archaeon]|nr:hypothetical protein [Candidatus Pacearchaeota archaeon]
MLKQYETGNLEKAVETANLNTHINGSEYLNTHINGSEFSTRVRKTFRWIGVHTFGDLVKLSANDLLVRKNFGTTSLNEVRNYLCSAGLSL